MSRSNYEKINPARVMEAHRIYMDDETVTLEDVCRQFGMQQSTMSRWFRKLKLETRGRGKAAES